MNQQSVFSSRARALPVGVGGEILEELFDVRVEFGGSGSVHVMIGFVDDLISE